MKVYADNAATTCMLPCAIEEMTEAMEQIWGNASTLHAVGQEAKVAMEAARYEVAAAIGAKTAEITFTSGGSEANNQALLTLAAIGAATGKMRIVTTTIEHPSVLKTVDQLKAMGFNIRHLEVPSNGILEMGKVERNLTEDTVGISVMTVNNEIGTVQNIHEIGTLCKIKGVLLHTDAVQAVGHMPIDVDSLGVDLLSMAGHKFGGPKGVGALYARSGIDLSKVIQGGAQERDKRAGTENVPAIVGMAAALTHRVEHMDEYMKKTTGLRDRLMEKLLMIPGTTLNGDTAERAPGIVSVCFDGIESETLLVLLDQRGICVSAGSACAAGAITPSHVLTAIGRSKAQAMSAIRFSLDIGNTEEDIDYIADTVNELVEQLRSR